MPLTLKDIKTEIVMIDATLDRLSKVARPVSENGKAMARAQRSRLVRRRRYLVDRSWTLAMRAYQPKK